MIKLAELLDEKHLTPAELKKREEIVKGLKKSGMKQSPKMYAIATAKAEKIAEGEDHEVAMAQASLKSIIKSSVTLLNKLGNMERDIPGWIQDHITNAENYIDQAAQGFHELNEVESTQSSYAHMRPFKLEIAKIMSQLGALNDKIEKKGPLSKEIVKAFESLGMLISNINTDRKI
jgi:hypothetical protein